MFNVMLCNSYMTVVYCWLNTVHCLLLTGIVNMHNYVSYYVPRHKDGNNRILITALNETIPCPDYVN